MHTAPHVMNQAWLVPRMCLRIAGTAKQFWKRPPALQVLFRFADGEERRVPGAYIEFAERAPLPEFAYLPVRYLKNWASDGKTVVVAPRTNKAIMVCCFGCNKEPFWW